MPDIPNMGLEVTCGQPISSAFSIADHCFISSEMGGIFGRSRIVGGCRLAGLFRFVFFALITCVLRWAWVWAPPEAAQAWARGGTALVPVRRHGRVRRWRTLLD